MSGTTSLYPWQDQFLKNLPNTSKFTWTITGAKASTLILPQSATLGFYDTITQGTIDAFYGSVNEVLAAKYDSTAMGTDAFGVLLNFSGQVQKLVKATLKTYQGTGNVTVVEHTVVDSGLTDSSLTNQGFLTTLGNVALRFVSSGLDGFTSGLISLEVEWVSK